MPPDDPVTPGPPRTLQLLTAIRLLRAVAHEPRTRPRSLLAIGGALLLAFPWLAAGTWGADYRLGHIPVWLIEPLAAALAVAGLTLWSLRREWRVPPVQELLRAFEAEGTPGQRCGHAASPGGAPAPGPARGGSAMREPM